MTTDKQAETPELTEDEIKASFVEFINWVKPNTGLSPYTVGTIQKVFKEVLKPRTLFTAPVAVDGFEPFDHESPWEYKELRDEYIRLYKALCGKDGE